MTVLSAGSSGSQDEPQSHDEELRTLRRNLPSEAALARGSPVSGQRCQVMRPALAEAPRAGHADAEHDAAGTEGYEKHPGSGHGPKPTPPGLKNRYGQPCLDSNRDSNPSGRCRTLAAKPQLLQGLFRVRYSINPALWIRHPGFESRLPSTPIHLGGARGGFLLDRMPAPVHG